MKTLVAKCHYKSDGFKNMDEITKGLSLNENPAVPDTSGVGSVLMNKNQSTPTVTIGNLIIKSTPSSGQSTSFDDEVKKIYKDTAL